MNWRIVVAASFMCAAATLTFKLSPLMMGIISENFALGSTEPGFLGTAHSAGMTLVAASATIWLPRTHWAYWVWEQRCCSR